MGMLKLLVYWESFKHLVLGRKANKSLAETPRHCTYRLLERTMSLKQCQNLAWKLSRERMHLLQRGRPLAAREQVVEDKAYEIQQTAGQHRARVMR